MTIQRMGSVGIVVNVGLDGVRSDIAMMWTPGGHSRLGLTRYHTPAAIGARPHRGELARYGDSCWLCCVRGPEGIMVALAEQLG